MPIAIEKIMDMLEVAVKNPGDRWKALREMIKLNKNNRKPASPKKKARRGRPPKNEVK